jgi:glutathione S-transferase
MNWIAHADATLTFPQTITLRYSKLEPGKCDVAAEDYAKWYLARLRMLDNCLADGREFLVGNKFTIADICIAYALYVSPSAQLTLQDGTPVADKYSPQVLAYLARMTARPAFIASRRKQAASLAAFKLEHPSPSPPAPAPVPPPSGAGK